MRTGAADPWWKASVVYEVYPRSFADSNGDGVGDLPGVLEHLDHIADLGADVIWLSPVYRSPHDDNGYDISDYYDVDPAFGTLDDLDRLIGAAHRRGIKVILDLVVNHTSDEHPWFVESRTSRQSATSDWYIWRDPRPGGEGGAPGAEPNNWGSFFSGPAWEWVPDRQQYYLHLFSRKQPDLNWENEEVRGEVFRLMNWWLDRGIDGFRMDVINFISKHPELPDGSSRPDGYGDGLPYFSCGPRLREFLQEMNREVFHPRDRDYLTVGEMPGVTTDQAAQITDLRSGELNMVFQFDHVELDQTDHKWSPKEVAVIDLKRSLGTWQSRLSRGWNSLYWNNHDQPRVVSRFGNDTDYWYESATALAAVMYLHRGTPCLYQGEEIGMTNVPFSDVDCFRDIESLNHHADAVRRGQDPAAVLRSLRRKSRDNARTPMQWDDSEHAGFTAGEPWIPVNPNYRRINAADQRADPGSVFAFYKRLLALRRAEPTLIHGDFTMLAPDHPQLYAFARQLDDTRIHLRANLSDRPLPHDAGADIGTGRLLLSNYPEGHATPDLRSWEVRVVSIET